MKRLFLVLACVVLALAAPCAQEAVVESVVTRGAVVDVSVGLDEVMTLRRAALLLDVEVLRLRVTIWAQNRMIQQLQERIRTAALNVKLTSFQDEVLAATMAPSGTTYDVITGTFHAAAEPEGIEKP